MQVNIYIFIYIYIYYISIYYVNIYSFYTSNFETTYKKPPFIKIAILYDLVLVSNYHGCKGEDNKINTILYDRYYLQSCKAITFKKIANHTTYKKPNVPSHLHIC